MQRLWKIWSGFEEATQTRYKMSLQRSLRELKRSAAYQRDSRGRNCCFLPTDTGSLLPSLCNSVSLTRINWSLLRWANFQIAAQLTGNTSLAYYAPQIFTSVGAGNSTALITGFFGVVKVVAVLTFCVSQLPRFLSIIWLWFRFLSSVELAERPLLWAELQLWEPSCLLLPSLLQSFPQ